MTCIPRSYHTGSMADDSFLRETPRINPAPESPFSSQKDQSSGQSKRTMFILGGVLGGVLLLIVAILFSGGNRSSQPSTIPIPKPSIQLYEPTEAPKRVSQFAPKQTHYFLYVKDGNIFLAANDKRRERQLTIDADAQHLYSLPKWFDTKSFTYVACYKDNPDEFSKKSCSLIHQDITGDNKQTIFRLESMHDSQGKNRGGTILQYEWNDKHTEVAYVTYSLLRDYKDPDAILLRLRNVQSNTEELLDSFVPPDNRVSSLDDELSLLFSEDGKKLLYTYTALYISEQQQADRGTLFVYDTNSHAVLWQQPQRLTTFGRWLDNDSFIAKQFFMKDSKPMTTIIRMNFAKQTQSVVMNVGEESFYTLQPLMNSMVLLWSKNPLGREGIRMETIDLDAKNKTVIKDQVFNLRGFDDGQIAVRTMRRCYEKSRPEDECGADLYNGFKVDGIGLVDIQTREFESIPIDLPQTSLTDFDVR